MKKMLVWALPALLIACIGVISLDAIATASMRLFNQQVVIDDALEELSLLVELSCDLDCVSSQIEASFEDGTLCFRDSTDAAIYKPDSGQSWLRTTVGFDYLKDDGYAVQMVWGEENAYEMYRQNNGVIDVRAPLLIAAQMQGVWAESTGTAQGVDCIVLSNDGTRLWFDENSPTRLLRYEVDYADSTAIAFVTEFSNWTNVGAAEFPLNSSTETFLLDGTIDNTWSYEYRNVQTGLHLTDSDFTHQGGLMGPGGGGGLPGGGIGGSGGFNF
jgi:hypothetical protein